MQTVKIWSVAVAAGVLLAACSGQPDGPDISPQPTRNPCAQLAPPTVKVPANSKELAETLKCTGNFPVTADLLAPKQIFTDLDLFTQAFIVRWQQYLRATGFGAVSGQPKQMSTVLKLDRGMTSLPVLCEGYASKKLPGNPIYCRVTALPSPSGVPPTGFVVLPVGYDGRIKQYISQQGERQGLVSISLQLGVLFAKHLRNELQAAGIMLPTNNSSLVDVCLAGISLRAVFPLNQVPTEPELINAAQFAVPYLDTELAAASAIRGYQGGQLFSCI